MTIEQTYNDLQETKRQIEKAIQSLQLKQYDLLEHHVRQATPILQGINKKLRGY